MWSLASHLVPENVISLTGNEEGGPRLSEAPDNATIGPVLLPSQGQEAPCCLLNKRQAGQRANVPMFTWGGGKRGIFYLGTKVTDPKDTNWFF